MHTINTHQHHAGEARGILHRQARCALSNDTMENFPHRCWLCIPAVVAHCAALLAPILAADYVTTIGGEPCSFTCLEINSAVARHRTVCRARQAGGHKTTHNHTQEGVHWHAKIMQKKPSTGNGMH
jgi:hypothetical protein